MRSEALRRVRDKAGECGFDTLMVTHPVNVRYLTGVAAEASAVLIGPDFQALVCSPLYSEHARSVADAHYEVHEAPDGVLSFIERHFTTRPGERIGYEADVLTCAAYARLDAALDGHTLVPTEGIVARIREHKYPQEIASIVKAQRIAEKVLADVQGSMRAGMTESSIAAEIDHHMRLAGGERSSFDTIVASGPNTSLPHAVPTDRRIGNGDLVLIDMGTVVDGYCSDMTRTFVVGQADDRAREVYAVVLDALATAAGGIHAGIRCADADALARDIIEKAGYGDRFIHTLGHGVGLEIHEQPRLNHGVGEVLADGMVVTIEPGIYIPGWGGVRIEDMVVVREDGCEVLTRAPRELVNVQGGYA